MKKFLATLMMIGAVATGFCALATLPARALVEINVNKGTIEPLPIAITDFQGEGLGPEISGIVEADLKRSGLFAPLDHGAFIEKISNPDMAPRFDDWKVINAQALVTGRVSKEADGRIRAEYRLWDTFAGQQMAGEQGFEFALGAVVRPGADDFGAHEQFEGVGGRGAFGAGGVIVIGALSDEGSGVVVQGELNKRMVEAAKQDTAKEQSFNPSEDGVEELGNHKTRERGKKGKVGGCSARS